MGYESLSLKLSEKENPERFWLVRATHRKKILLLDSGKTPCYLILFSKKQKKNQNHFHTKIPLDKQCFGDSQGSLNMSIAHLVHLRLTFLWYT